MYSLHSAKFCFMLEDGNWRLKLGGLEVEEEVASMMVFGVGG